MFQALGQWGRSKKWAGDKRDLGEKRRGHPARRLPDFSIVHTDREPGTGYMYNRDVQYVCSVVVLLVTH